MLDPWIIEEIRRREEERRRDDRHPAVIEMPVEDPRPEEKPGRGDDHETPRGVTVIDFRV